MTPALEWLVVGVCLAIARAVHAAFTLNRRRRLHARTERTHP